MTPKASTQVQSTYLANTGNSCTLCCAIKHPLYTCKKFKVLSSDHHNALVWEKEVYLNCLKTGRFKLLCLWGERCQKCQNPHHTLLHHHSDDKPYVANTKGQDGAIPPATTPVHTAHTYVSHRGHQDQVNLDLQSPGFRSQWSYNIG